MESLDSEKKNYELGLHLNPNLEETRVLETKEAIEKLITSNGGVITFSKVPEKAHLSYEVQHERSSYFGYIHFSLQEPQALIALEEYMKLNNDVLRHIVLKLETDAEKKKASAKAALRAQAQEKRAKRMQATAPTPATEKDAKEMEKQLEDVIEGL